VKMIRNLLLEGMLVWGFVVAACDNSFTKGSLVDRTRVVGVRIEAKDDAARSSIGPGESMRATWLVASPNGTPRLGWSYALCASPTGNFPDLRCEGPTLKAAAGVGENESIVMDVDVPPGDTRDLILLVAFCENGVGVALDAGRFEATCADNAPSLLASARIKTDPANRNPDIVNDAIVFDGSPLLPTTLRPNAPCLGATDAPVVPVGSKHKLGFRLRGEDREPGETLIVSHVTTKGEFDRQYSALEIDEVAPKNTEIPWNAPGVDPGENGTVAEFFFVLRDGRGGAAFARRAVCVRR
jgi:hypothetical protein